MVGIIQGQILLNAVAAAAPRAGVVPQVQAVADAGQLIRVIGEGYYVLDGEVGDVLAQYQVLPGAPANEAEEVKSGAKIIYKIIMYSLGLIAAAAAILALVFFHIPALAIFLFIVAFILLIAANLEVF